MHHFCTMQQQATLMWRKVSDYLYCLHSTVSVDLCMGYMQYYVISNKRDFSLEKTHFQE